MNGQYRPGDVVLGNWQLTRQIGEGSFGKVYEARREDFGVTYRAAVKIITIPQSSAEVKSARAEGMDEASVTAYFRSFVEEIVQEFVLMSKLKGHSNVVSYEDHTVIPHTQGVGWDIIIRMEMLTPLLDYMQSRTMARKDVIQLGIHICKALELCQKFNIIHRDIKPENICVSDLGDYKLGDFGIARTVEKTTGGLSKKGTFTYMAPEIYRDEPYGSSVDIYSLGLVMYRLLNNNRAPFLPDYPAPITHSDREISLAKRMSGAKFPPPKHADGRLAEIVLKACAYQPRERYSSPMQMAQELEAILYDRGEAKVIYPQGDEVPLRSAREVPTGAPGPEKRRESAFSASSQTERTEALFSSQEPSQKEQTECIFGTPPPEATGSKKRKGSKPGKKLPLIAGASILVLIVVLAMSYVMFGGSGSSPGYDEYTPSYDYVPDPYVSQPEPAQQDTTPDAPDFTPSSEPRESLPVRTYIIDSYVQTGGGQAQGGKYETDRSDFLLNVSYETVNYEQTLEDGTISQSVALLSCLPYALLQWDSWEPNRIRLLYCDPEGTPVEIYALYDMRDGQFFVYPYPPNQNPDEENLGEPIVYQATIQGYDLTLERNGCSVTLVPLDLSENSYGFVTIDDQSIYVSDHRS